MKERTKRLQALFCALAVTATSVGSPLVSVPVYAEETQGAEDTSEHPETENGKATDTSDNAISESPDQVEKLIPENPNPEPVTEDEGDSSQKKQQWRQKRHRRRRQQRCRKHRYRKHRYRKPKP